MTNFVFTNDAFSTLAGAISNTATTCQLAPGTGILFPTPGSGQQFTLTFTSASNPTGPIEIVYVTGISGDQITSMIRGQEGTSPQGWLAGDLVDHVCTAGTMQQFSQAATTSSALVYSGTNTGTGNSVIITTLSPSIVSLTNPCLIAFTKDNSPNTSAMTATVLGQEGNLIWPDGSAFIGGDFPANTPAIMEWNGTAFALQSVMGPSVFARVGRVRLSANANYYITTTGSDNNSGTSTSPWLTLQHAWNFVQQSVDLNGYQVTINVADGIYTTGVLAAGVVVGGNNNNATSAAVVFVGSTNAIINVTNNSCFTITDGAAIAVQGFTLNASGTYGGQGSGLFAANLGLIRFQGTVFGNCAIAGIRAGANGAVICDANFSIAGSGYALFFAFAGGSIYLSGPLITVTASGACSYSVGTAWAQAGTIYATAAVFPGTLVSGPRYAVALGGVINTAGGGANYFCGSSAGTNDGTGVYA